MKLTIFVLSRMLVLLLILTFSSFEAIAGMRDKPPEIIDAIIVGDRAVDIAWHLGVLPEAMSIRGSSWPMAKTLKTASQIIGCPKRITVKAKETLPDAIREYGIHRVIIERSAPFSLYCPQIKPERAAELIGGLAIEVAYIDLTQGVENAIVQMGKLLGKEEQADELKAKYVEALAKAKRTLPVSALNKKAVVFNGVMQQETGKGFLRVEAPGFYSDRLFLERLGMRNVGALMIGDRKIDKGHLTLRQLHGLLDAQPDVIILTGDSLPFQLALAAGLEKYPALAEVPAVRNRAIYNLPQNIGSSVIDYPDHLLVWSRTLGDAVNRSK